MESLSRPSFDLEDSLPVFISLSPVSVVFLNVTGLFQIVRLNVSVILGTTIACH